MNEGGNEGRNERGMSGRDYDLCVIAWRFCDESRGWIYDSRSVKMTVITINQRIHEYQQERNSLRDGQTQTNNWSYREADVAWIVMLCVKTILLRSEWHFYWSYRYPVSYETYGNITTTKLLLTLLGYYLSSSAFTNLQRLPLLLVFYSSSFLMRQP